MTYAPATLTDLGAYWVAQGGKNLGIVGDTSHINRGWSYHLGKDNLADGASSARTARDKAGLTNAASALDLGKLDGSYVGLRDFSKWLVAQGRANASGTRDIREVIYSPDGKIVLQWDRERGMASTPVQLDPTPLNLGHLTHTHISFYRDSEARPKVALFRPYFEEDTLHTLQVPVPDSLIMVNAGAVLYDNSAGQPSPGNKTVSPARNMPWLGSGDGWRVVEYIDEAGVRSKLGYYVRPAQCGAATPVPAPVPLPPVVVPPDAVSCKPFVDAAVGAAVAADRARAKVVWT